MTTRPIPKGAQLTPRELQVLELACDGLSDAEIAQQCQIASLTVKHHMRNVYSKIGVKKRPRAIVQAIQTGLITPKWLSAAWSRRPG